MLSNSYLISLNIYNNNNNNNNNNYYYNNLTLTNNKQIAPNAFVGCIVYSHIMYYSLCH